MNLRCALFSIAVVFRANVVEADLPTILADFESTTPIFSSSDTFFGGSAIVDRDHGVGVHLEMVRFTNSGVLRDNVAGDPGFPTSLSIPGNQFVAHGPPMLAEQVPTDTRGLYLQVGADPSATEIGDLFDLVSIDATNYIRSGGTTRDYRASRLQFTSQQNPPAYTRRTATGGWVLTGAAGPIVDEPPTLKFETILLAESIATGFPVEQFQGIRSAFIGYDDVRALDDIRVRWSRENFAAPTTVEIIEQELSGDGLVTEGTAVFHRPSIEAFGDEEPIVATSTERRVFRWGEDTLAGDGFPLRVAGELEFEYVVENGGFVQVQRSHSFKRIGGGLMGSGSSGRSFSSAVGQSSSGVVSELTQEFLQTKREFGTDLVHSGADYEVITTLTVTVDPRGGHAAVFFDRGWEVRIAGTLVPEPSAGLIALMLVVTAIGARAPRLAS